ncbi:PD-(D/E)XK nuclease family protein [Robertkochia aurantiaca]|uniref:PD-(D/E)XK nuclease family protein n=1 Tax=Robertkochia aurantiaca TaxID=2873700 RepID=UPI001CCE5DC8|nr:PD-(D/E)XK nuclease family protein [Robertkochia sp. 3YJGBD-33]
MDRSILPVESVQERDIDLLLLEELNTHDAFAKWFVHSLNLPELTITEGAWKSITAFGLGETDILLSYFSNDKKVYLLIENKLDACFQDEQYHRYKQRSENYIASNDCDLAFAILVAPELYCKNQNDFDSYVTYEEVADQLKATGTRRSWFKSELLRIAIEKLRRGYHPVNSEPVQAFWHAYWRYREEYYPDLEMKRPDIVPHQSDWPMMYDRRLNNIVFYHKFAQGNTDATFFGYSEEVKATLTRQLPNWAKIKTHTKSFSIRVNSSVIDRTKNFNDQIPAAEEGLKNLNRIRDWIIENEVLLH